MRNLLMALMMMATSNVFAAEVLVHDYNVVYSGESSVSSDEGISKSEYDLIKPVDPIIKSNNKVLFYVSVKDACRSLKSSDLTVQVKKKKTHQIVEVVANEIIYSTMSKSKSKKDQACTLLSTVLTVETDKIDLSVPFVLKNKQLLEMLSEVEPYQPGEPKK